MKKKIVVLLGGISGEREISFITGKSCSKALVKKGYKVRKIDAKGNFVEKVKKINPKVSIVQDIIWCRKKAGLKCFVQN